MKLTIGMPSYNNYQEVWFTVQALRMYHELADVELLVIDNFGSEDLKNFIAGWASGNTRYVRYTDSQGTAAAKNRVFAEASGEWVFCIDSHILLVPGTVARLKEYINANPDCMDLLQGPILWDNLVGGADSLNDTWSSGMWGQWNNLNPDRTAPPYEIPRMGMGLFGCRKDAWLGFNPAFRGFGGEEGYLHAKYKLAGRRTLCLPWLQWVHHFRPAGVVPYNPILEDKVRNYTLGFMELGLDLKPLYDHFGEAVVRRYKNQVTETQTPTTCCDGLFNLAVNTPSDINEHLAVLSHLAAGRSVVEFGVREGISTIGWLQGRPKRLTSYDLQLCPRESDLKRFAKELDVEFDILIRDSREVAIDPTDIVFIDTLHTEKQLTAELNRHAEKAKELIVLHDTHTFGEVGEDGGPGLNHAVRKFLDANKNWKILAVYTNNNGLTILSRGK